MTRRVFVHAGTMKSGTSYLQTLCDCNMDLLAQSGVLWTWSDVNFLAMGDLLGTRHQRTGLAGTWEVLKAQLDPWDGDALISNELLAEKPPQTFRDLVAALNPAEVHVIITARDLARSIPSQWQTGVRNGRTQTFGEFMHALQHDEDERSARRFWRKQNLPAILRRIGRVVPLERVTVVTLPPAGSAPSILGERFAEVLSVEAARLVQPKPVNTSLGAHSVELLRRVNGRCEDLEKEHYNWGFRDGLSWRVLAGRAGHEPAIALTADQLAWVHERASQLVREVAATEVRVVGSLADLMPAPEPVREVGRADDAAPTERELLDIAVEALAGLGRLLADTRIAHDELVNLVEGRLPVEVRHRLESRRRASYRENLGAEDETYLLNGKLLRAYLGGDPAATSDGDPRSSPPRDPHVPRLDER